MMHFKDTSRSWADMSVWVAGGCRLAGYQACLQVPASEAHAPGRSGLARGTTAGAGW